MSSACFRRAATVHNGVPHRAVNTLCRTSRQPARRLHLWHARRENLASAGCLVSIYAAAGFVPCSLCSPKPVGVMLKHGFGEQKPKDPFANTAAAGNGMLTWCAQLRRSIRMLMRAVALLLTWSPVAVSGCVVAILSRYRFLPESWRTELREAWWKVLLKVLLSRTVGSQPTLRVQVNYFSLPPPLKNTRPEYIYPSQYVWF